MHPVSPRSLIRVRWAVRAVLVLGIAASVAANVLHAEPNAVARVIAAWSPIALLLTLELIARVPVRRGPGLVRVLATAVIAGIAAWVSYWHMAGVAARYGEATDAAHLLPLSVDGLIVVASVSLVELSARIRHESRITTHAAQPEVDEDADADTELVREPALTQVSAPDEVDASPDVQASPEPAKPSTKVAPKRTFATTQRAAAAMQADGMTPIQIAEALGITDRQARRALRPTPVTDNVDAGMVPVP